MPAIVAISFAVVCSTPFARNNRRAAARILAFVRSFFSSRRDAAFGRLGLDFFVVCEAFLLILRKLIYQSWGIVNINLRKLIFYTQTESHTGSEVTASKPKERSGDTD